MIANPQAPPSRSDNQTKPIKPSSDLGHSSVVLWDYLGRIGEILLGLVLLSGLVLLAQRLFAEERVSASLPASVRCVAFLRGNTVPLDRTGERGRQGCSSPFDADSALIVADTPSNMPLRIELAEIQTLGGHWAYDDAAVSAYGAISGGISVANPTKPIDWDDRITGGSDRVVPYVDTGLRIDPTKHLHEWIELRASMTAIYPEVNPFDLSAPGSTFSNTTKSLSRYVRLFVISSKDIEHAVHELTSLEQVALLIATVGGTGLLLLSRKAPKRQSLPLPIEAEHNQELTLKLKPGEIVQFEAIVLNRVENSIHTDCHLTITNERLVFQDAASDYYSFEIRASDLRDARIRTGVHHGLIIRLKNNKDYRFNCRDADQLRQIADQIGKINPNARL